MFLRVEKISKSFGNRRILNDITFEVQQNELISIIGPSGAGKTTLLKIIAGLETADGGTIHTTADLTTNPAILVFQDYVLFPHMSVFSNVAFGLRCRSLSKPAIARRVMEMLDFFHLGDKYDHFPSQLSAGQQQRVALARAMVVSPSLLLLDEPFANLDRNLKTDTAEFIRSFQKSASITTICVTHDLQEAFMISDKIGVMLDGRLPQFDDTRTVYHRPVNASVAAFTGHVNVIPHNCLQYINTPANHIAQHEKSALRIRAEAITLTPAEDGPGIIDDILFAGHYNICRVQLPECRLTAYSLDTSLRVGMRVAIAIQHF